jgi:hypothetical protein
MIASEAPECSALETRSDKEGGISMATTKLLLATGDRLEVEASLDEVVKELENAARSSAGTLAQLTQAETGEPVAINAAQVVMIGPSDE